MKLIIPHSKKQVGTDPISFGGVDIAWNLLYLVEMFFIIQGH
jgi:hypothetical protein